MSRARRSPWTFEEVRLAVRMANGFNWNNWHRSGRLNSDPLFKHIEEATGRAPNSTIYLLTHILQLDKREEERVLDRASCERYYEAASLEERKRPLH